MTTRDTITVLPEARIAGGRQLPREIQKLIDHLSEPFPIAELRVRPGQTRRDGTAAQALPYAEWWRSYQPRLDALLGRANWSIQLIPWGSDNIIARMTVFDGLITRDSTGSSKEAFEGGQDAEAQAMKRVCARTVGLGLFLYFLPEVWAKANAMESGSISQMARRNAACMRCSAAPVSTLLRILVEPDRPSTLQGRSCQTISR